MKTMKTMKNIIWIAPLALLIAGCAAPQTRPDPVVSQWERDGTLPWVAEWQSDATQNDGVLAPTGKETQRVYGEVQTYPANYPASEPNIIIVDSDQTKNSGDVLLADAIRQQVEYDRGLAPSLQHVTIEVRDGRVIISGVVRSDLDARVIVDDLRDITGVIHITNNLEITSAID